MNHKNLVKLLVSSHACKGAIKEVKQARSVKRAWEQASVSNLVWLIFTFDQTTQKWQILLDILKAIEPLMADERSKNVITLLQAKIDGQLSAADAADAAADAAVYAYAAADAAANADARAAATAANAYAAAAHAAVYAAAANAAAAADAADDAADIRKIIDKWYDFTNLIALLEAA